MITCIKSPRPRLNNRYDRGILSLAAVFLVDKSRPRFTSKRAREFGGSFLTYESQKCRSLVAIFIAPEGKMSQQKLEMFPSVLQRTQLLNIIFHVSLGILFFFLSGLCNLAPTDSQDAASKFKSRSLTHAAFLSQTLRRRLWRCYVFSHGEFLWRELLPRKTSAE